ncbi:MAG TPA: TolC family protein [Verrucomicrobiales bacterium]|nr:TolC family protein [Verrucomicrobiales bacterium]HIL68935.1 TolC family protein [Verrucomicrobiota bacterium]
MNHVSYKILFLLILALSGCMSSKSHVKKADQVAAEIISEYQQEALGHSEPFTIEESANSLRLRLMISQELPGHVSGVTSEELFKSNTPLKITLLDALQFGARNNRNFQQKKESVFSAALNLDLSRASYRNSYSGLLSSMFSGTGSGDNATRRTVQDGSARISRKLQSGATLSSRLGLDLVKLLTMDKTSTFGVLADATISIPLLRGAGSDIAREPLTQAERNTIYAMWEFERFKKTFAVNVARDYLRTLEIEKQIQNSEANYKSIVAARERVEDMSKAGRTSQTQVDQAKQNELQASNSLILTRQNLEAQLDSLKMTIGIPVDAMIELEASELTKLSNETMSKLSEETTMSASDVEKQAAQYVLTALEFRLDLKTTKSRYEDAKRKVKVAEDSLDPDMRLILSGSTRKNDDKVSFSDSVHYNTLLTLDLPWDKTQERVAFRRSIIALRNAERSIEEKEDSVKQELRSAARKIAALRETYLIQELSVELAARRVESTDLFLQAGQSQIRDLLEAQEDLVEAQDNLVSAVVNYHIETLNLQRNLELLEVNEKGLWRQNEIN